MKTMNIHNTEYYKYIRNALYHQNHKKITFIDLCSRLKVSRTTMSYYYTHHFPLKKTKMINDFITILDLDPNTFLNLMQQNMIEIEQKRSQAKVNKIQKQIAAIQKDIAFKLNCSL